MYCTLVISNQCGFASLSRRDSWALVIAFLDHCTCCYQEFCKLECDSVDKQGENCTHWHADKETGLPNILFLLDSALLTFFLLLLTNRRRASPAFSPSWFPLPSFPPPPPLSPSLPLPYSHAVSLQFSHTILCNVGTMYIPVFESPSLSWVSCIVLCGIASEVSWFECTDTCNCMNIHVRLSWQQLLHCWSLLMQERIYCGCLHSYREQFLLVTAGYILTSNKKFQRNTSTCMHQYMNYSCDNRTPYNKNHRIQIPPSTL